MYADTDAKGRIAVMDLTTDEAEIIRQSLTAYRANLVINAQTDLAHCAKYQNAGQIARHIERVLEAK